MDSPIAKYLLLMVILLIGFTLHGCGDDCESIEVFNEKGKRIAFKVCCTGDPGSAKFEDHANLKGEGKCSNKSMPEGFWKSLGGLKEGHTPDDLKNKKEELKQLYGLQNFTVKAVADHCCAHHKGRAHCARATAVVCMTMAKGCSFNIPMVSQRVGKDEMIYAR